jgi:hypothetical protein
LQAPHPSIAHAPAGLPADNDRTYCTSNVSAACYFYQPTAANYATAKAACLGMGGFLASWNSAHEQVRLRKRFGITPTTRLFFILAAVAACSVLMKRAKKPCYHQ